MNKQSPGLEFIRVGHRYGPASTVRASTVRDVSFSVTPGDVACLLGPSGCGKTTLLRLAAGLETLQQGRIKIGGETAADSAAGIQSPPERRNAGLMFQDFALFPHLTVMDNILFGLRTPDSQRIKAIKRRMLLMGVDDLAGKYPHMLSGGQQQRIALLRALAPEPRVMLLDEPFSGLDVNLRAQVREDTLRVLKDSGVTTLMVTHDPEEAMYMADDMLVMSEGRIVQSGPPARTYQHPVSEYVAALFGPVNRITGKIGDGLVHTALGDFPLNNHQKAPAPASSQATVLIRQEGVRIFPAAQTPPAAQTSFPVGQILSVRLLGRDSHVRIAANDPAGGCFEVRALVHGVFAMREGSEVGLEIDPGQSFVFPA